MNLNPVYIEAFDLDDAWFQCLSKILDKGYVYTITRGSYAGQKRLEFDFVVIRVKNPKHQIIPIIPEGINIPPPTSMEYLKEQYLPYLMTPTKTETEDYTYGERLEHQIGEVIKMYREKGEGTNQATMEIGMPTDIRLNDPPCLRLVDTRLRYGRLHFYVYFRSWDLWGGFPSNLGGLQLVKQYMADEIGVEDGEMIAMSKGLHLYDHAWDLAKLRTGKNGENTERKV